MSNSICLELTCNDYIMSRPGGVKDSHPLNTTETGDKRSSIGHLTRKGFSLANLFLVNKPHVS